MSDRGESKVNINSNPQVAEGDTLPYPLHKVLGVLPTEESAWQVIAALKARGAAEEEMDLWTGQTGAAAMEETVREAGLIGRLRRMVAEFGMEGTYIEAYEAALRNSQFLLAVPAADEDAKNAAAAIMADHGARHVTYFDQLTIERLTA